MARNNRKQERQVINQSPRALWAQRIDDGSNRYNTFWEQGRDTMNRYRSQRENAQYSNKDKYNILYSSTETTKPSLYAQTPRVQATKRHRDRNSPKVTMATMLIEAATQYAMEDIDFDGVLNNCVKDYLLPGLGVAWVRYDARFRSKSATNDNGEGTSYEVLDFEGLALDYVHYCDVVFGPCRTWAELPWVARRVYYTKAKATKRFGKEKADKLKYSYKPKGDRETASNAGGHGDQAIIWEIWDKDDRKAHWYSPDFDDDLLDSLDDPLNLNDFFPCPEPIRAVWTTDTFVPTSFFSQYKAQADALDDITGRIRRLTQALRAVGVYDASQAALGQLLTGTENRMVPIENWAQFAGNNGIAGSVQWVPIKDIALVLTELYRQRDIAKAEIYEITGFSDIVRGVSKASETLGAQQIKADWAGGRLKEMQKEVQRFCRDIIRIMSEIISEHFSDESLALYAGFEPPEVTPEEQQAAADFAAAQMSGMPVQPPQPTQQQQAIEAFKAVVEVLRKERTRCANIGIETDSTIQPDEAQERADRMEFLGQIGAFLQQAGPMALQYPDMRGLLGAIMMFVVRTFRSSRPIEKEFEDFQRNLQAQPPMSPDGKQGEGGDNGQAAMQTAQIKAQSDENKVRQESSDRAADRDLKKYEIDQKYKFEAAKIQADVQIKQIEVRLKEMDLQIKQAELALKQQQMAEDARQADTQAQADAEAREHQYSMDYDAADREDQRMDDDRANKQADREAQAAAQKPASGD